MAVDLTPEELERYVAFIVDWDSVMEHDATTARPSLAAEAARIRAMMSQAGVPATYWAVVAQLYPLAAPSAGTPSLAALVNAFRVCMGVVRGAQWSAAQLSAAVGLTTNPRLYVLLEALQEVHEHQGYYDSLCKHVGSRGEAAPAPDPATEWLEEVLVRRLYRRNLRSMFDGSVLVDVPFGSPEDIQPEPRISGWFKPFSASMLDRRTQLSRVSGRRREPMLNWFTASATTAKALIPTPVHAALRAAQGKLVLAGGAALHAVTGTRINCDFDLFLVGCRDKAEALDVIQRAVHAATAQLAADQQAAGQLRQQQQLHAQQVWAQEVQQDQALQQQLLLQQDQAVQQQVLQQQLLLQEQLEEEDLDVQDVLLQQQMVQQQQQAVQQQLQDGGMADPESSDWEEEPAGEGPQLLVPVWEHLSWAQHEQVTFVTVLSDHVLTVMWQDGLELQFVLRLFRSTEEVLATFDLPACCFAFDGRRFHATPRALYALRYRVNLADPMQQSTVRRAFKYTQRGFRYVVPGWQPAWEAMVMRARDEASEDELVAMMKDGGLKAIIAFCHLPNAIGTLEGDVVQGLQGPGAPPPVGPDRLALQGTELVASNLYLGMYNPSWLLDAAWRQAFLEKFPHYRVFIHETNAAALQADEGRAATLALLPPELLQLLVEQDEPRWLIRNPAVRMYSVEQFYNLDVGVHPSHPLAY